MCWQKTNFAVKWHRSVASICFFFYILAEKRRCYIFHLCFGPIILSLFCSPSKYKNHQLDCVLSDKGMAEMCSKKTCWFIFVISSDENPIKAVFFFFSFYELYFFFRRHFLFVQWHDVTKRNLSMMYAQRWEDVI